MDVEAQAAPGIVEINFTDWPVIGFLCALAINFRDYVAEVRHIPNGRRAALFTIACTLFAELIAWCVIGEFGLVVNWYINDAHWSTQIGIGVPVLDQVWGMSTGRRTLAGCTYGYIAESVRFAGSAAPLSRLGAASSTHLLGASSAPRDLDA